MARQPQQKKKSKKADRNRKWCQAYRMREQRDINKGIKLARTYKRLISPLPMMERNHSKQGRELLHAVLRLSLRGQKAFCIRTEWESGAKIEKGWGKPPTPTTHRPKVKEFRTPEPLQIMGQDRSNFF